jgi:hypothetical protein
MALLTGLSAISESSLVVWYRPSAHSAACSWARVRDDTSEWCESWRSLMAWWTSSRHIRQSDSAVTSGNARFFCTCRDDKALSLSTGSQNVFSQLSSIFFSANRSLTILARSCTILWRFEISFVTRVITASAEESKGGNRKARSSTKSIAGDCEDRAGAASSTGNGRRVHNDCKSFHSLSVRVASSASLLLLT